MMRSAVCLVLLASSASLAYLPGAAAIDARVRAVMAETHANGMAIAVIEDGRVVYVQAYGARNAKGDPLQTDTVMYGASLTKTVMAYSALTLVDQGKLDLDAPLAGYLERPLISYGEGQTHLAKYGPYRHLAGDECAAELSLQPGEVLGDRSHLLVGETPSHEAHDAGSIVAALAALEVH